MIDLKELRRLLEASTPGPWTEGFIDGVGVPCVEGLRGEFVGALESEQASFDAALITALRNAAPALLAVVEAAMSVEAIGPRYVADEHAFEHLGEVLEPFR